MFPLKLQRNGNNIATHLCIRIYKSVSYGLRGLFVVSFIQEIVQLIFGDLKVFEMNYILLFLLSCQLLQQKMCAQIVFETNPRTTSTYYYPGAPNTNYYPGAPSMYYYPGATNTYYYPGATSMYYYYIYYYYKIIHNINNKRDV